MANASHQEEFLQALRAHSFPLPWPGHLLNGNRVETKPTSQNTRSSNSPNDGSEIQSFSTDRDIVGQCIRSAEDQLASDSFLSASQRLQFLKTLLEELIPLEDDFSELLRIEVGKPGWEAKHEAKAAIKDLTMMLENGEELFDRLLAPAALSSNAKCDFNFLPVGVVAAYLPFSTPLSSLIHYVSAAISGGSPIILFTSNHATAVATLFSYALEECNLPKGLVQMVYGGFKAFKNVLTNESIRAILYTGSREHCEEIRTSSSNFSKRRLILQSGGKNIALVHSSAQIEQACQTIAQGAFRSAGQLCSSTSRVIVHEAKLSSFTECMRSIIESMYIGPTAHRSSDQDKTLELPDMGPLYSAKSVERFLRYQTMANRESSDNILWGSALEDYPGGHFVRPGLHVMNTFEPSSIYQNSILFCPDVAVYSYSKFDDAIHLANQTDTAFSLSFLGDSDILLKKRHRFKAPNLLLNLPTTEIDANLPLAGKYSSASNRFHGVSLALYLSNPQVVQDDQALRDMTKEWQPRYPKT